MTAEATALGAVIAGGIGVGLFPDFGVVDKLIPLRAAESPDPSRSWYYAALLEPFRQAYTALKPVCAELTSLATRRPAPKTSGSL
jgi:xylulokinase